MIKKSLMAEKDDTSLSRRVQLVAVRGILVFLTLTVLFGEVKAESSIDSDKQFQAALSLNYAVVSLERIISCNDRVVLNQEHDAIISNLNIRNIPDKTIICILQKIMDLIVRNKNIEAERDFIRKYYKDNVVNTMRNSIGHGLDNGSYTSIASVLASTGSMYFNYRTQLDQYRQQRERSDWELDRALFVELNSLSRELLNASWELLKKYEIPDEWRLTPKQIKAYLEILKDNAPERRYRRLERIMKSFSRYPPYWYYIGRAAQECKKTKEALAAYDKFDKVNRKIFRKDKFAASVAMNRLVLLGDHVEEARLRVDLATVCNNSENSDWANLLFAACQYAKYGHTNRARELVMANIDNGYTEVLGSPETLDVLGESVLKDAPKEILNYVIDAALLNNAIGNQDLLHLYGKMRNEEILKKVKNEIASIAVKTIPNNSWNFLSDDEISVSIPLKWLPENVHKEMCVVITEAESNKELSKKSLELEFRQTESDKVLLVAADAFDIEEILEKDCLVAVELILGREKLANDQTENNEYEVIFRFISQKEAVEKSATQKVLIKLKDSLSNAVGSVSTSLADKLKDQAESQEKRLVFVLDNLQFEGEEIDLSMFDLKMGK